LKDSLSLLNIDLIISNEDLDELCRKLPIDEIELFSKSIRIAQPIKEKLYMSKFLEEIRHYVEMEEI
jgi:bloom syndrome protein